MQIISANEAKTHFGKFLDTAQRAPVRVARHNRVVGVMVSAQDYDAMRAFYADRLRKTFTQSAKEATEKGLTESQLDTLLSDEN